MLPLLALALVATEVFDLSVYDHFELTVPAGTAGVSFRHDSGATVTAAGFDDGGPTKVRFMPTKPGTWTYPGGHLTAATAGRRGPIRVDPAHPHHFVWEGTGEHVFLNGTTAYWLLGVTDDDRIAAAIDRLAKHKVNRIRVALNARTTGGERWFEPQVTNSDAFKFRVDPWVNRNPGDPKKPDFDLGTFDVAMWQKLDRLVRHARDKDVLVSVIFHLDGADVGVDPFGGGKAGMKTYAGSEAEWNYYRYAAARLSAYSNVMWDVTNEWHLFRGQKWVNAAGGVLRAADPYKHLTTVHGRGDYPFYASPWSDFALYQQWDEAGAYQFMRTARQLGDKVRPMPHVNEEYGYEDHYPGKWGGNKKPPARAAANRAGLAWEMAFAGGYQTTGERADVPGQGGWLTGLGDDTMTLPALHAHMTDFFTRFEWWRCDPAELGTGHVMRVLADADRRVIAGYVRDLPDGGLPALKLPPGEYTARWYNPQTGTWSGPVRASGEWGITPPACGPTGAAVLLVRE